MYFNNANTLAKKVRFALKSGLGGVMIWELGQDTHASHHDQGSLLRTVWATTGLTAGGSRSWMVVLRDQVVALIPSTEEDFFALATALIGLYMMFLVLMRNPSKTRGGKPGELRTDSAAAS